MAKLGNIVTAQVAQLGNMLRKQNLWPGSETVFVSSTNVSRAAKMARPHWPLSAINTAEGK